jgi:hypothetical protein
MINTPVSLAQFCDVHVTELQQRRVAHRLLVVKARVPLT